MDDLELNRATETIERMQQEINDLQEEIALVTIRQEEGSGDIANRLVVAIVLERVKKLSRKTKAKTVTVDVTADFTIAAYGSHFTVSVRELPKRRKNLSA